MKKIILIVLMLVLSFPLFAQENFSSVEERMTGKEFMETGLSKLTDSELEALNKWLRAHSLATMESRSSSRPAATVTPQVAGGSSSTTVSSQPATSSGPVVDKRGFEGRDNDRTTIVSNYVGEFKGWDGETVFKLSNGMIWKQSEKGRQITKLMVNPQVTIKSGMFNSWNLTVEGYNRNVQVKRIQ